MSKRERSAGRARNQAQDFTATMLGTRTAPAFKLHGAETDDFILFAGALIERFGNELGDRRETISACQSAFATIRQLTRDYKTVLPDPQVQTFVTAARTALASFKTLGIPEKPKEPQGRETSIAPKPVPPLNSSSYRGAPAPQCPLPAPPRGGAPGPQRPPYREGK